MLSFSLLAIAALFLALTVDLHKPENKPRSAEREAGRYGRIEKEK